MRFAFVTSLWVDGKQRHTTEDVAGTGTEPARLQSSVAGNGQICFLISYPSQHLFSIFQFLLSDLECTDSFRHSRLNAVSLAIGQHSLALNLSLFMIKLPFK